MDSKLKTRLLKVEVDVAELEARYTVSSSDEIQDELQAQQYTLHELQKRLGPMTPEDWVSVQQKTKIRLDEVKNERQLFLARQGRFAGIKDEEYEKGISEGWYNNEIRDLETNLSDPDDKSRKMGVGKEVRMKARQVDGQVRECWIMQQMTEWRRAKEWEQDWRPWFEKDELPA